MTQLNIQYLDPRTLTPDPENPRRISKEAAGKLRAGIDHFGLVEPLVLNGRTGLLISGHQRRAQALELGFETVPVVVLDLDDVEADALSLLLNNAKAQGTWDTDLLAARLEDLHAVDALELTAFDVADLEPATNGGTEVSFTAKGHSWEALEHRIKCPKPEPEPCDVCDALEELLEEMQR